MRSVATVSCVANAVLLCSLVLTACDSGERSRLAAENAALSDLKDVLENRITELESEVEELQASKDELESGIEELRSALEEANGVISQAADDISNAQGFLSVDCELLQIAVGAMDEPSQVYEP